MNKINIKEFDTKKELFKFLVSNKNTLIAQKKSVIKHSDVINYVTKLYEKDDVVKEFSNEELSNLSELEEINVISVMNTTNIIDSHLDLHVKGLWTKTLKENKMLMHLQEHDMKFDKIIADGKDLKAKVQNMQWKELGFDFDGETQALIFNSKIKKERNTFMFKQYGNGFVRNHSVGMRYIKLLMAINDTDYEEEYKIWEKYYQLAVNKETADFYGYFWVVKEAQLHEGSAVPLGSNIATPTLEIKNEPFSDTQKKSLSDTFIDYNFLIKNIKLT